jgi:hypothetical protein
MATASVAIGPGENALPLPGTSGITLGIPRRPPASQYTCTADRTPSTPATATARPSRIIEAAQGPPRTR